MGTAAVEIREFEAGDEAAFRRLNEEWIERYFVLEKKDRAAFDDPQETILDRGGRIFFAVREGVVVGCCALVAMEPGQFEVAKMAVTKSAQGSGVGRTVLQHVVEAARAMGAQRLYLETNHRLTAAIALYERVGFRHLPSRDSDYSRANVFMEMVLEGT